MRTMTNLIQSQQIMIKPWQFAICGSISYTYQPIIVMGLSMGLRSEDTQQPKLIDMLNPVKDLYAKAPN